MPSQLESTGFDDPSLTEDDDESADDAVSLLAADHAEIRQMFESYRQLVARNAGDEAKHELAEQLCTLLTVHTALEEEIFYPAMRDAIDDDALVDEAVVEHGSARDLVEQIQSMDPGDDLYDAKVNVLGEYVAHHVEEEEGEMFPKAETSGVDLDELGAELADRKHELMADYAEE